MVMNTENMVDEWKAVMPHLNYSQQMSPVLGAGGIKMNKTTCLN